jgi:hypothetical protein
MGAFIAFLLGVIAGTATSMAVIVVGFDWYTARSRWGRQAHLIGKVMPNGDPRLEASCDPNGVRFRSVPKPLRREAQNVRRQFDTYRTKLGTIRKRPRLRFLLF